MKISIIFGGHLTRFYQEDEARNRLYFMKMFI